MSMPELRSLDAHNCILCSQSFASRARLKDHLIKAKKNGKPRCAGLKVIIPADVWKTQFLPYYTANKPVPNSSEFTIRKRGRPSMSPQQLQASPKLKRRLSKDKEIKGKCQTRLSQDVLLELLHKCGNHDMKWVIRRK